MRCRTSIKLPPRPIVVNILPTELHSATRLIPAETALPSPETSAELGAPRMERLAATAFGYLRVERLGASRRSKYSSISAADISRLLAHISLAAVGSAYGARHLDRREYYAEWTGTGVPSRLTRTRLPSASARVTRTSRRWPSMVIAVPVGSCRVMRSSGTTETAAADSTASAS